MRNGALAKAVLVMFAASLPVQAIAKDSSSDLSESFSELKDSLAGLWSSVSKKAEKHGSAAADWFNGVFDDASETAEDTAEVAKDSSADAANVAKDTAAKATRAVSGFLGKLSDKIEAQKD